MDERPYDPAVENEAYDRLAAWHALTPAEREAQELEALLQVPVVRRLAEERDDLRAEVEDLKARLDRSCVYARGWRRMAQQQRGAGLRMVAERVLIAMNFAIGHGQPVPVRLIEAIDALGKALRLNEEDSSNA